MRSRRPPSSGRYAGLALLWLAACTAGRFPSASAPRPLTMPEGEHQLVLGLGPSVSESGSRSAGALYYRYGITDRLDLGLPLIATYTFLQEGEWSLAARGGLYALGYDGAVRQPYTGDPRQPTIFSAEWFFATQAGLSAKLRLGEDQALIGFAAVEPLFSTNGFARIGFASDLVYSSDWTPWLSVNVALNIRRYIAGTRDAPEDHWVLAVGSGSDGYGFYPLLSWHAFETLDLYLSANVAREMERELLRYTVHGGIDLHFD